jgi:hypothetical protein
MKARELASSPSIVIFGEIFSPSHVCAGGKSVNPRLIVRFSIAGQRIKEG